MAAGGECCGPSVSHFWGLLQNSFGTTDVSELFEKHVYKTLGKTHLNEHNFCIGASVRQRIHNAGIADLRLQQL